MSFRIGSGYIGSTTLQTSVANQQVVPEKPSNWSQGYNFYKFSFNNQVACTVKINNGNPIYLGDNQGFECSEVDSPIWSFIIVESGINYNFIAAY